MTWVTWQWPHGHRAMLPHQLWPKTRGFTSQGEPQTERERCGGLCRLFQCFFPKVDHLSKSALNFALRFILFVYSVKSLPYYSSAALCVCFDPSRCSCTAYLIIFPKDREQGRGKETKQARKKHHNLFLFTLPPYSLWSSVISMPIATANCLAKAASCLSVVCALKALSTSVLVRQLPKTQTVATYPNLCFFSLGSGRNSKRARSNLLFMDRISRRAPHFSWPLQPQWH